MIYLYGASGHAKVIIEIMELLGRDIGGIKDDNPQIESLLNYRVGRRFVSNFNKLNDEVIISIGSNSIRKKLSLSDSFNFARVIHPYAVLSKRCDIGEGTVVMAGVSVNSDVKVGKHVILNTNCSIDHDCMLDDFIHISPNVALAGAVKIGEGTHIGIGACVIQGVTIGKWCTIGAGAVILKDIPDGATVVGNPGRIIKTQLVS